MRVAIDILHPAHAHIFKYVARDLEARGHDVLITARDKDRSVEILRREGFEPVVLSEHRPGTLRLAGELLVRTARFVRAVGPFGPDVIMGVMGPTIALAGKMRGWPSVVLYDTEIARRTNTWVYPLATHVLNPRSYRDEVGPHQVRYPGYPSLAYLHPSRFTPDAERVRAAGIDPSSGYVFFRFVAFESSHDSHEAGLSMSARTDLLAEVAEHVPIVVSSERPLPEELERFAYHGPVEDIHHVLAFAQMTVGESATMASESAVLGTPSLYIATSDRGYLQEQQERYGLVEVFNTDQERAFRDRLFECLAQPDALRARAEEGHRRLLAENVDVAAFVVEFLESHYGDAVTKRL